MRVVSKKPGALVALAMLAMTASGSLSAQQPAAALAEADSP